MTNSFRTIALVPLLAIVACSTGGCLQAELDENKNLIDQQQAQIRQMEQEIAALKTQQNNTVAPPPPGGCDAGVMAQATRHAAAIAKATTIHAFADRM